MAIEYLLWSPKHTHSSHCFMTFWGPNNAGYVFRMDWAGRYAEADVAAAPSYYDSGYGAVAVPAEFVLARAVPSMEESGEALRVLNTPAMRQKIIRAAARARRARQEKAPANAE